MANAFRMFLLPVAVLWGSTLIGAVAADVDDEIFWDRFQLTPGTTFQDCDDCPIMVVIGSDNFTMGSPNTEPERQESEGPQRLVSIPTFAMAEMPVTFDQWQVCVDDNACGESAAPGFMFEGGDRPVHHISWFDAQNYVTWLSQKSGQSYRLPTEAEWEFAARAGTTGRYNTGDCITTDQANFNGYDPAMGCPEGIYRQSILPVGSFEPNGFGVYEVHGNAREWVQDCWNDSYEGAPTDGSAWMTGDCDSAVVRGGAWNAPGNTCRSAFRASAARTFNGFWSSITIGLRVVKALSP